MASTTILSDNGVSSGSAGLKSTAGNDGVLILQTSTSGGTATNAIYVDTSQNVALGVAPSAWSVGKALELNTVGQGIWATSSATVLTNNLYYNGSYKFAGTGYASRLVLSGQYQSIDVSTTSGSAGGAITFVSPLSTGYNQTVALQGASQSAGTGIAFPATQSASSDANTLDDYEEGTFTCTLTGSSSNPTGVTYFAQDCKYTKVGNLVTVFVYCGWSTYTGGSGTLRIAGLPFAAVGTIAGGYSPGAAQTSFITYSAGYTAGIIRTAPSSTFVDVQMSGSNVGWTPITFSSFSSGASQKEVLGCLTYFTST